MLVSETVAAVIAWGIGGLLMLAGAVLWYRARRDDAPFAGAYLLLVFLGYMVAISRFANGTPVLLVRDGGSAPVLSALRAYGSPSLRGAHGQSFVLDWMSGRHLVVNDTTKRLVLRKVLYGYGASSQRDVAAFEVVVLDARLRHIGPNQPPPSTIDTGETERYWLTW